MGTVVEPAASLGHYVIAHAGIDHISITGDTLVIENVEFTGAERRGDFVFDDLDLDPIADDLLARLDLGGFADFDPDRGIEFQSHAAGGRLRIAEHHADFHTKLVDEYHGRF